MKRLLFLALNNSFGNNSTSDGVTLKIKGQCKALVNNGWDVWLLAYKDENIVLYNFKKDNIEVLNKATGKLRRKKIFSEAKKIVSKMEFNTVYIRYPFSDYWFISMLKYINKKVDSIYIEIPTFPIERWKINYGIGKFILSRLDYFFGIFLRKYVKQFRIIGSKVNTVYGVPTVNISNGIDCTNIQKKKIEGENDTFVIITVSRMTHYHGYDRLIKGLQEYYNNSDVEKIVRVIMVGEGSMKETWMRLARDCEVDQFIDFVGLKTNDELSEYFDKSHVAIGSLGLHRVGLTEISTLKCKEYCARGIPFACSNKEIDFDEEFPFLVKLPADESPIDIKSIINSYENIKKRNPDYINSMRQFAERELSWTRQMQL